MQNFSKQLPPLEPLVAFEAAARLGSFALAATELNITPSAISQRIRVLEQRLNAQLFVRGHRSVELTEKGRHFQNSVAVALMHLTNAAAEIRTDDSAEHLEIATDTSISAMWLMPRLERFEALFPGVSLRLTVTDVQSELLGSRFQLALAHGEGDWRGQVATKLFDEEVFPVCSPDYLRRLGGELSAATLPECDLLDLEFEQWHWMNWAIWLTEMDLPLPTSARRISCNNYPLLIDAARRGAGVGLGWRCLVDEDLASGALVAPLDATVKTRFAYYLLRPFNDALTPVAARFRDWIMAECQSCPAEPSAGPVGLSDRS